MVEIRFIRGDFPDIVNNLKTIKSLRARERDANRKCERASRKYIFGARQCDDKSVFVAKIIAMIALRRGAYFLTASGCGFVAIQVAAQISISRA